MNLTFQQQVQAFGQKHKLTERETEILQLLVNRIVLPKKIAKALSISVNTVNNHMKKLFSKTQTDNKSELLAAILLFLQEKNINEKYLSIKPNVLIIDDENDFCNTLADYLNAKNIQTFSFYDPVKALEESKKLKIDVIISDIRMPKMDGLQFLTEIRKAHYYEPGVIFVSGFAAEHKIENLLDKGAFAFLEKPVDFEKIYRLIHEYLLIANNIEAPVEMEPIQLKLENNIILQTNNIGFGGFFLDNNTSPTCAKLEKLKCGDKLSVSFQLDNDSHNSHSAVCEVVWSRATEQAPFPKGLGLRFIHITPQTRQEIFNYVRLNKILSFIPAGYKSKL